MDRLRLHLEFDASLTDAEREMMESTIEAIGVRMREENFVPVGSGSGN